VLGHGEGDPRSEDPPDDQSVGAVEVRPSPNPPGRYTEVAEMRRLLFAAERYPGSTNNYPAGRGDGRAAASRAGRGGFDAQ
jgi:hypothetical protein